MLGLDHYGSDSEDDSQSSVTKQQLEQKTVKKAPKRIAIGLPVLPKDKNAETDEQDQPPTKKPRLNNGAAKSSLLSMLPAPKQAKPTLAAPQRVLGGGQRPGLDFTSRPSFTPAAAAEVPQEPETAPEEGDEEFHVESNAVAPTPTLTPSTSLVPPSLRKGRPNISLEEPRQPQAKAAPPPLAPAVDFFSLGSSSSSKSNDASSSNSVLPTLAPAPVLPTFEVPEPTLDDEYPGYYQLPSGAWAAHDPEYYNKFVQKWKKEYDDHVRKLEKSAMRGFEGMDESSMAEIDAAEEREKAKREVQQIEERKALTKGVIDATTPSIKLSEAKRSKIAHSRHQLATMLNEAFTNREALEARIAEGKRNRKEAGNKYGF